MMRLEPKCICAEEGTLTPEVSSAGAEPKTHCWFGLLGTRFFKEESKFYKRKSCI